uniref:CSON002428 protein n=1 Tax=Culicoides sonorensis TaxID=179676 RepID=A0A336MKH9_CULSO
MVSFALEVRVYAMKLILYSFILLTFVYHSNTKETDTKNVASARTRAQYGITYGTEVDILKYPYFVRIWFRRNQQTFFCGGCIVNINVVLTAAHCVYQSDEFLICSKSSNTQDTSSCQHVKDKKNIIIHKGFHEAMQIGQFYDDLALIHVEKSFFETVSNLIALAPLCSVCDVSTCKDHVGKEVKIIGCGETATGALSQKLQEADQVIIDDVQGKNAFPSLKSASHKYNLCYTLSATSDKRISSCSGDSGSPLLIPNPVTKQVEVCGVASFGTVNCTSGQPSGYTYIGSYMNFIKYAHDGITLDSIQNTTVSIAQAFRQYNVEMKPRSERWIILYKISHRAMSTPRYFKNRLGFDPREDQYDGHHPHHSPSPVKGSPMRGGSYDDYGSPMKKSRQSTPGNESASSQAGYEDALTQFKDERDAIQKKTFTKWVNKHLKKASRRVDDLFEDLRDGHNLLSLLEVLSGEHLPREKGKMRFHMLQNAQMALDFLRYKKIKLVNIRAEDIVDGNPKLTLGLIWTIILHFQFAEIFFIKMNSGQ